MVCNLSLFELVYITMKSKEKIVLCYVLFYFIVEDREIRFCQHLLIFLIKVWIMPMCLRDLTPWSSYWKRVWYSFFHILREIWAFILMVSFCPTCSKPNIFSFLFFFILVQLKCKVLQILLQVLYCWIGLLILVLFQL
jgi:hypothetical protein